MQEFQYTNQRGDTAETITKKTIQKRKTHNSRGIPTAEPADSIRSYEDCKLIQDYFLYAKNSPRDYMLFTLGCATGLRISDLVSLRISDVLEEDNFTFKRSISILEEKTGKPTVSVNDEVYLTEAARDAISLYLDSTFRMFSRNDHLFKSRKPNKSGEYVITPESGHRIMKDAQRYLNLPINMGSHTMRKTFLTLAFHIALRAKNLSNISLAMGVSQMMARHSNVQTTMAYMKENKKMLAAVREKISDFLMGKSDITVLDIDYTEML